MEEGWSFVRTIICIVEAIGAPFERRFRSRTRKDANECRIRLRMQIAQRGLRSDPEAIMIHRFWVQNFTSLVDVDVDLSPVTVLIGRSGTGKSNFVQALRFLRDVLVSNQALQHSWLQLRPVTAPNAPTSFFVEFSVDGINARFQYELTIDRLGPAKPPSEERLSLGGRCLFHQISTGPNSARWATEPDLVHVPPPGAIAARSHPVDFRNRDSVHRFSLGNRLLCLLQ